MSMGYILICKKTKSESYASNSYTHQVNYEGNHFQWEYQSSLYITDKSKCLKKFILILETATLMVFVTQSLAARLRGATLTSSISNL